MKQYLEYFEAPLIDLLIDPHEVYWPRTIAGGEPLSSNAEIATLFFVAITTKEALNGFARANNFYLSIEQPGQSGEPLSSHLTNSRAIV